MKPNTRHSGLSIVETLIAMVILMLVVAAVTESIVTGQVQMHASTNSQRANMLVQDLMEQALSLPYDDPNDSDAISAVGPEPSEPNIAFFDNADDFHNYTETTANCLDPTGAPYSQEFDDFSRSLSATYDEITITGITPTVPGLTLTVTVQDTRGHTWTASRYITEPVVQ